MTFRFPEELAEEIIARAKATGKDRTAVVVEALSQVFGLPLPQSQPTPEILRHRLDYLEEILANLSEQVTELGQASDRNQEILCRLAALEQTVALLQASDESSGDSSSEAVDHTAFVATTEHKQMV